MKMILGLLLILASLLSNAMVVGPGDLLVECFNTDAPRDVYKFILNESKKDSKALFIVTIKNNIDLKMRLKLNNYSDVKENKDRVITFKEGGTYLKFTLTNDFVEDGVNDPRYYNTYGEIDLKIGEESWSNSNNLFCSSFNI